MLEQLKRHPTLACVDKMARLCKPLTELGITTFSHLNVSKNNRLTVLCNNPKSFINYIEKKYYEADPCVSFQAETMDFGHYLAWDYVESSGKTREMLADSTALDFKHVFTIINKNDGINNFYHFGTHLSNIGIEQLYLNNLDLLVHFITYFNEQVSQDRSLSKAYSTPLNKSQTSSCIEVNSQKNLLSSVEERRSAFLNSLCAQNKKVLRLTQKEMDCGKLLLQGKTAKEIAKIVGISYRTIEDRISVIKDKLKAKNKVDLLRKLIDSPLLPY
ncbi:helix-turn-helix transcriptional regulator [Legionella anisa]|uniref:helix-turn-helix transcriptional regulator n=1 Tax=Legionella anisa TaxID=28082 RepID=UPI0010412C93|nr:helix-turn-helix transcriptional regulator [Legionella anisa]